jgi:hypothetical protein
MHDLSPRDTEHVALCEVLDRVLNKGAVLIGEVRISVANIDLIYLGLQIVLTSIEGAREIVDPPEVLRGFEGDRGSEISEYAGLARKYTAQ